MKPGGEIKTSGTTTIRGPICRDLYRDDLCDSGAPADTKGKEAPEKLKDPFALRSDISLQHNAKQESTFERYFPLAMGTVFGIAMGIAGLWGIRKEEELYNKALERDKSFPKWREDNKDLEDKIQRDITIDKAISIFGFAVGAASIGLGAYQYWQDHQKSVSVEADSKSVEVKYTKDF